jgi:hypothetical protein
MASTFPGAIDNFTDPLSGSALNSPSHSAQHADLNDAVEKIETNMGLVLIKTATVTNAADTGATWRSVFDSRFTSYRLVCRTLNAHTNGSIPRLLFYYGTSTEQASTYYSGVMNALYNGTSNVTSVNNGAFISIGAACDNVSMSTVSIDFHGFGISGRPSCLIQSTDAYSGGFGSGGGYVNTTQTYTGFKMFMSAGNISMTGTLYGYRI